MAFPRLAADTNLALTVLGVWFVSALATGASGLLGSLRPLTIPVILLTLAALALVLGLRVSPLREWVADIDPRWLVGFHLTRYAGLYALVLYDRGELPHGFALYGGIADITMATLAVLLLLFLPAMQTTRDRAMYGVWNALGLVSGVATTAAAIRSLLIDPASMTPLVRLPLSLVATFVLPLVLATHGLLLVRLAPVRSRRRPRG